MKLRCRILFIPLIFTANILLGNLHAQTVFSDSPALFSFSTEGYSVYHLKPGTIDQSGMRVIISAAFDGTVLCHSQQGKLIWKNESNKDFPFDLAVADTDSDGLDESFIATAGGFVYAYDHDGRLLWTFSTPAPLYQVCPVLLANGEWRIYTGGVQKTVFILSAKTGLKSGSFDAGNVVRHVRKGNILGDGKEYVAIATTSSGLNGTLGLILYNPNTMTQLWRNSGLGINIVNSKRRFFSMIIADTDNNGKDNIILSASWSEKGQLYGFDEQCNQTLSNTTSNNVTGAAYRMNMLAKVDFKGTDSDFIFGIFGNNLIIYNADGSYNSILESKYDFSNATFDPETNTFYLGSSPSGGDGIYAFNLNNSEWKNAFQTIEPVGRLARIEQNIAKVTAQINQFVKPEYQRNPPNVTLFTRKPSGTSLPNLLYGSTFTLSQTKIPGELWCNVVDSRMGYNMSKEDILTWVRQMEANKQNFALWAGHGEAVYMSPSTMEAILREAPVYFQGFIFAEMEQTSENMKRVVTEIINPLAQQCSAAKKKIIFRNKNIFWTGTCYLDFWSVLLNPQFHDVFVPALEETNSRTQEMSLASRVGLWKTGIYDNWAERAVTDNACFDRMWEWSSQQVMSHYLRELVMRASLGADFYQIDVYQGNYSDGLFNQLIPFYDMVGKGVIAIPKRDELLSVSDVCIGMKSPPDQTYMSTGLNGHGYTFIANEPMVFDRMDAYWGASPLLDHDFSKYGFGAERRMLNFLPKYPHGLVTIVPDNIDVANFPWLTEKISTDGKSFYTETGIPVSASSYKETVLGKLTDAAQRLPVLVKGDVAWSVVRLDNEYIRITLIDPGYTDPDDREAEIKLQHLNGISAKDILSGENIDIVNQSMNLSVPAGIFRIIDVRHEALTALDNQISLQVKVFPNPTVKELFIQFDNVITQNIQVSLTDLTGKTLYAEIVPSSVFENRHMIEINQKGIFILKIVGQGINHTERIICF